MLVFVILIQIFIDVRPYNFIAYMYVPIDNNLPIFVKKLFVYWDVIYKTIYILRFDVIFLFYLINVQIILLNFNRLLAC